MMQKLPLVSQKRRFRLWSVLFWLALWQLGSMALDQPILLVSPLQVVQRLFCLLPEAAFWNAIGFSLARIALGFFSAACLGVILAALSSRFSWVQELLAPPMAAIRAVPVASFVILALIWISSRNLSVLISFLIVLPVIYTNTLEGICSASRELNEMARVFRLPAFRWIRWILIPQVFPYFHAACHISLGLSWKSGIAAEVIGIPSGSIGERLQQAKVYLDTPDLFAWTLVIVLASLTFEKIVLALLAIAANHLKKM